MEKRYYDGLASVSVPSADDATATGKTAYGYAAVFNSDSVDLGGFVERIQPGAFARSLALAANGQRRIYMLWSHDEAQPLGSTGARDSGKLILREDDKGLAFEFDTTRMTVAQIDAIREGDIRLSFGFIARDERWTELADGSVERTLIDADLFEISLVVSPAYADTTAALRSLETWKQERAASPVDDTRIDSAPITISEDGVLSAVEEPRKFDNTDRLKRAMQREIDLRTQK